MSRTQDNLLAGLVLRFMNQRARRTFFYTEIGGYSWKETATFLGTTANSAQVLFNQALGKVRARISKRKGSKRQPGKGGEAHA